MTYVLTYKTQDAYAYGEFLVDSWENKPTRDQLVKCGVSLTFNTALHKNGTLFLNGRIYIIKESK